MVKKVTFCFPGFIFFILLSFSSCEMIDKEEEIPSYIRIDSITLITEPTQGSKSHKITDAWVYIDNELIGAFELPVTFPVLKGGQHEILVRAGIKMNGIAATRVEYPFYNFYSSIADLKRGSVITITPSVKYFPAIKFPFIEDFEGAGFNFSESPGGSDTTIQITSNATEVFEGSKSGIVFLDANKIKFEAVSSSAFTISPSSDVYLEMNYKTNNEFVVGIYPTGGTPVSSLHINPNTEWNKIYVNLTNDIRNSSASSFKLFIGMLNNSGVSNPQLFIDNVKIVHQ